MKKGSPIITFAEAITYLDGFTNYEQIKNYGYNEKFFDLKRMGRLLDLLGNPQRSFKSIHVAGTKGKGSVCVLLHAALQKGGFKTGLYTSPHLISFRERIQVQGELITEKACVFLADKLKQTLETQADETMLSKVTTFELYTAMAFMYFNLERVKWAVVETGMGGRLDATNLLIPEVSVLTPISLDHIRELGNTVQAIALEKCGIIKDGIPTVSAPQEAAAMDVIQKTCAERKSHLSRVWMDVLVTYREWDDFTDITPQGTLKQQCSFEGRLGSYNNLSLSLLGEHQVTNAATAIACLEVLQDSGSIPDFKDWLGAWAEVYWPARFQVINGLSCFVVDGAHNEAAALVLRATLKEVFEGHSFTIIFGMLQDKDAVAVGKVICPIAEQVIFTQTEHNRAFKASILAEKLGGLCEKHIVVPDILQSVQMATQEQSPKNVTVITGSFYLAGEALKIIQKRDGLRVFKFF